MTQPSHVLQLGNRSWVYPSEVELGEVSVVRVQADRSDKENLAAVAEAVSSPMGLYGLLYTTTPRKHVLLTKLGRVFEFSTLEYSPEVDVTLHFKRGI